MEDRRVVVTGMGIISPIGNRVDVVWDNVVHGRGGVARVSRFDVTDFRSQIAAEVKDFDASAYIPAKEARRLDPFCHYAMAAAMDAVADSGLDMAREDSFRVGVLIGSGIGGIQTMEEQVTKMLNAGPNRVSPFLIPMLITDMASGAVSIRYGMRGPNFGMVSACASATHALGEAFWVVKRGDAEVMVSGGSEGALCPIGLAGFCAMKAVSSRNDDPAHASRPFDADRDGFVMGEGAGILVLEELEHAKARGARIYAELAGYGATGDAHHVTAPCPDGAGATRAIQVAMEHGRLNAEDISYINAHGTSTPLNDYYETLAIKAALGEHAYRVPVSSTKALTGHGMGAAGGIEAVIVLKAMCEGVLPATWNYETPDPKCDLDYVPNECREADIRVALSSNFGFGGHNGVIAFRRFDG